MKHAMISISILLLIESANYILIVISKYDRQINYQYINCLSVTVLVFLYTYINIYYYNNMINRCQKRGEKYQKPPGSNINININFSVRQKANYCVGKKMDNCIELPKSKNTNNQLSRPNLTVQTLKQKKKNLELVKDMNESKKKKVQRTFEHTPEKKNQHSKSTKALNHKKSGKSLQNIRHHQISPSDSRSRSKSGSKSQKKLIKKKKQSKTISIGFQNSGIKQKLNEQTQKKKGKGQKLGEEDFNNIRAYMNEKKKKQKKQRQKQAKIERAKSDKIKQGLKKVQVQRKNNASLKISRVDHKGHSKSTKRLPIFCIDDQNFDEENDYNKLKKQADTLIYQEPSSITNTKRKRSKSAGKTVSSSKKKKKTIMEHFFEGHLSSKEEQLLHCIATTIQKHWRGYKARSQIRSNRQQNKQEPNIQTIKKQVDIQHEIQQYNNHSSSNSNYLKNPYNSHDSQYKTDREVNNNNEYIKRSDQQSQQQFHSARENRKKYVNLQKNQQAQVSPNSHASSSIMLQIQELKKHLEEQNYKNRLLEEQNQKLKHQMMQEKRLRQLAQQPKQQSPPEYIENISECKPITNFTSHEKQQPQQSSSQQIVHEQKNTQQEEENRITEFLNKKKKLTLQTEDTGQLKKIMQSYECSPRDSLSVSRIKDRDLIEIFQKKQVRIQHQYKQKTLKMERLLKQHLLSPRTYNMKILTLKESFQRERQQIKLKKQQVQRVAKYLKVLQEEQEKYQQSPKKYKDNQQWVQKIDMIDEVGLPQPELKGFIRSKTIVSQSPQKPQQQEIKQQINQEALKIYHQIQQRDEQIDKEKSSNMQNQSMLNASQSAEKNQKKGFDTNLTFIKQYCIALCEYIRAQDEYKIDFRTNIATPITFDSFELIKSYRTTLTHENTLVYNSHKKDYLYPFFKLISPKILAIPHTVFQQFNSNYDKLANNLFVKNMERCFLQSILDAFNQALDFERPGSVYGQQMPWQSNSKYLKNHKHLDYQSGMDEQSQEHKFDKIFGVAIARLIQWGSCLCGFIPQSLQLDQDQQIQFDQQQINQVRQTRMALMLQKTIVEDDESMINSQIEQTQVLLNVAQIITEQLLEQFYLQMNKNFY